MRTVFAVALCLVLGACATFGGGEPDIYGIYDLQTSEDVTVWIGLEKDGSFELSISGPAMPEDEYHTGGFSILEEKDGCFWGEFWVDETPNEKKQVSICDEVFTQIDVNAVFHKRR